MSTSASSTARYVARAIALAAAVLLAPWAMPDDGKSADADVKANVSVVVRYLDVVVTDRTGDPITDLTKDDFEVYEEGEIQQITDFVARRPEGQGQSEDAPVDERPYVVLLFDVKHMSFGELDRPRRAALRVLDDMLTPETVTAAMVLRDRLEVISDFSTDHDGLKAKVDEVLWRAPGQGDPRRIPELPPVGSSGQGPRLAVSLYPRYSELGPDHSLFGVLEAIGSGLGRMRGPKTVILFSEGISGSLDDVRVATAYQRMIGALNAGNVSVVSIDAGGLRGRVGRGDRLFRSLPAINLLGGEGKSSLRAVAKETGGQALIGSSNMSGFLEDTFEARSVSYLIGYSPKVTGAGGYRSLEVKCNRRGAKVIARKGFQDEVPPEEVPPAARKEALDRAIASWTLWQEIPVRTQCVPFPISGKDSLVGVV
ncbi:MAG: VWA domain-containing protein, partial [Acidobacteriota bacterium]